MRKLGTRPGKTQKKPLPVFRSLQEEAEFWDSHDSADYFTEKDLVPLRAWTRAGRVRHIYVAPNGSRYELVPLKSKQKKRVSA